MYYVCKNEIHGKFARTCEILKKSREEYWRKSQNRGTCTCLTSDSLDFLISHLFDKIFFTIKDEGKRESSSSSCGAVYEISKIQGVDEIYEELINAFESLCKDEHPGIYSEYFKSIKFKVDVVCCYAALTNNNSKESLEWVIKLLNGNEIDVNQIFDNPKDVDVIENIRRHSFHEEVKHHLLDIYKCCLILKNINKYRKDAGYLCDFDKHLFISLKSSFDMSSDIISDFENNLNLEETALQRLK